jgi:GNAT superfamily N-acetyltransferase
VADDLYARGAATLVASWDLYAAGATDAALLRCAGVTVGVFASGPEREIYNNALFDRGLNSAEREAAIVAMQAAYSDAGVGRYAAWVHESDEPLRADMSRRGFALAESTRAMGMVLDALPRAPEAIQVVRLDWEEYVAHLQRIPDVPAGLLSGVAGERFHVLGVREGNEILAAAIALDLNGDCGIYNMGTVEAARRRGLATALTIRHLHDATERGCTTASLQATPIAERVYASAGFQDLGRFLEFAPPGA